MSQISLISQVWPMLFYWDGVKHSIKMFETSNRIIKSYLLTGLDGVINPSTVKQVYQYNRPAFDKVMNAGGAFVFEYQYITYTLEKVRGLYRVTVYNPKAQTSAGRNFQLSLTHTGIKKYSKDGGHNDVVDVMDGLIKVIQ